MPEGGKEFPLLNGINLISGPSSAPASGPLERSNPMGAVMLQQQLQPSTTGQNQMQQHHNLGHLQSQQPDKDKEPESEPQQLTAIFRPDEGGDWKEKLRLSHEAQSRADRVSSSLLGSWDRRREDDDDVKDEEPEVEDEDSSVVGESDGNSKMWKAKRTLRKSVADH